MARLIPRLAIVAVAALGVSFLGGGTATAGQPDRKRDSVVQVYLTRHGETILNSLHLVQGWSDSPLTAAGRTTAKTVGANLRADVGKIDAAYSADMVRHFETATLMVQGMRSKLPVARDQGLRELNFGGYEGAKQSALGEPIFGYLAQQGIDEPTLGQMSDAIKATNPVAALPAENCDDVSDRMLRSLNSIAKDASKQRDDKVLVVSSGLSISCVIAELGAENRIPDEGIANGAVNLLEYKAGTWVVKTVNDTKYAQGR